MIDFRNEPFKYEPKLWNSLNDEERSVEYSFYMEWLGGINPHYEYTDNVNVLNPKDEDNLYKKLKAYILLCRRYRDRNTGDMYWLTREKPYRHIQSEDMRKHLDDLKELVTDNFNEIVNNLVMSKWFASIVMCFLDLGSEDEKILFKDLIIKIQMSRIDWTRGRTLYTMDPIMNKILLDRIRYFHTIDEVVEELSE
jgi:hypothetical protein